MKKALVITYYWPPAGGSGVQRWLKFVKYFRDFNVEPIVYTVKNPKYAIEDKTLKNDIPIGVEVLRKPIWEPNNIISLFGKSKQESAGFLNPNPSFFGKILQYIRANLFIPDARKFWVKPSVSYLKNYLSNHNIDVVITTGPPHSVHLIGLELKKQLNVKWIADFRDPWTEIDYFHQLPLSKASIKKHFKQEKEVVSKADIVLVVGKTMKENFEKYNSKIEVITNGFDGELVNSAVDLDNKFTLTHVGLMNADRNPGILWEAFAEISTEYKSFSDDFCLRIIGKIDSSIKNSVEKFNLQSNVEYIDYVEHSKVIEFQKKSQVLLLAVNNVPSAKGIITGKIFEYLRAKRPILAIAPEDGDLAEILNNTNAGVTVGFKNKAKLKKCIVDLYTKYKNNTLKVQSENIEQFHRKELTKKVSEIIYQITE